MKNHQFALRRSVIAVAVALTFPAGVVLADDVQDLISPNASDVSIHVQDYNKVNPQYRYYSGINQNGADYSVDANIVNRDDKGDWLKVQARDLGIPGIQEFGASYEKQGDWRVGLDYNEITKYSPYDVATGVGGIGSATLLLPTNISSSGGPTSLSLERTATTLSANKFFSDHFKFNFSITEENKSGEINAMNGSGSRVFTSTGAPATLGGVGPVANLSYTTQLFAPQPEDYKHTQISASLDYFTKTLQLSAGYYGSFFSDNNTALNIQNGGTLPQTGSLTTANINGVATTAKAPGNPGNGPFLAAYPWSTLPASNHFQQLYVDGAYAFSPSTHANFKLTTGKTVQDAAFMPNIGVNGVGPAASTGLLYNPAGVIFPAGINNTNLGGSIDTNTAAFNLTSHLANNLDLMGSWRYEDRNDKTPIEAYGGGTTTNFQNSETLNNGKVEIGYRFGEGYQLVGNVKYDGTATPFDPAQAPLTAWRDKVNEDTYSIALRKSMSDTFNGSATLSHANRTGSPWQLGTTATGVALSQQAMVVAPLQWGDRTRDAAKLLMDWSVTKALSLQAFYEYAQDKYSSQPWQAYNSPTPLPTNATLPMQQMGLTSGTSNMVGLDLSYAINKNWKATAFASYNLYKTEQNQLNAGTSVTCSPSALAAPLNAGTACVPFGADFNYSGGVVGASLSGKLAGWDVRAKYLYEKDVTEYNINFVDPGITSPVDAGAGKLTDSVFTINRLQLSAVYPYSKTTKLRFDYMFDIQTVADYGYAGWGPSDGTQLIQPPRQITQAFGVTLTQAF